jgi:multidrug efflux pump subunit AcrA (membrane-fusion protein)
METLSHTADPRDFTVASQARGEHAALSESLDLRQLHRQLAGIIGASDDAERVVKDAVEFVSRLTSAQLVVYFAADAVGGLSVGAEHRVAVSDDLCKYWLELLAGQATQSRIENRLQIAKLQQNRIAMSIPVERPGAPAEALAAVFLMGAERPESFAVVLQLMAGLLSTYYIQRQSQTGEWEVNTACAILDLVVGVGKVADVREAGVVLVNSLKDFLDCERVAVGLKKRRSAQCKLLAISGMSDLNLQAELPQAVQGALSEAMRGGDWTVWPGEKGQTNLLLSAHAALGDISGKGHVCSAPLRGSDGNVVGAWVFWGLETADARGRAERFARVSAAPVGTALDLLKHAQVNPVRRLVRKWRLFERKSFWIAMAAIVLLGFSFWPYRVTSDCVVEPVKKRFVVAPFAGVFEKSLVRPGDVVEADQKLAQMDGRELRMELASVMAEYHRARKSRDVNVAAGKTAAAQIDALEMQTQDQKRQLLESRIKNLDIKSPTAGIVVPGDLERSGGAPVTAGQALYEIAPLDRMIVEVEIHDEDVAHVEVGQKVAVKLDAYPGKVWNGTLEKIHPRSEIRDSKNVFIAEVSLGDDGEVLHPGMKGSATVTTSSHTLLWICFNKAWYTTLKWLGM